MQVANRAHLSAGRLLAAALGLGLAAELLFFGLPLGLNLLVAVALLLVVSWITRRPGGRMDPFDLWIIPGALVFAALVALRSDPLLVLFDVLAATALAGGAVLAIAGVPVTRRSVMGIVFLGMWLAALMARGAAPLLAQVQRPGDSVREPRGSSRALPLIRGLFLAVPVLLVFGVLFAQADAIFARLANGVLQMPDLHDLPYRLAFAGLIAWASAAILWIVTTGRRPDWTARTSSPDRTPGSPSPDSTGGTPSPDSTGGTPSPDGEAPTTSGHQEQRQGPLFDGVLPLIGSAEAIVLLVAVDLLFTLFVALQVAYLFGGRDTLAASGLTYSEYARRGFFELIAVVVLVGGLVVALETTVPRRTRSYVWATSALVVLAGVVLVSALLRLRLYQDAYGWTELRFYALAAIAWLGACLAVAAVTVLADRTGWLLHGVAIAALVVAVGVNVLDPPAFVARENLARALDPSRVPPGGETGFDAVYLAALGYDAVPVILDALPRLPNDERQILAVSMARLRNELHAEKGSRTWQGWNLARERARERLESDPGVP